MGFLKGSMKHLQIHIFIIFRVHKLIPNCQFLVSSILDLASLLEACAHQDREHGGLGIPHIKAKLEAYQATWIAKDQTRIFDIQGIDWAENGILNYMIDEPNESCHATRCIKAWNGMVAFHCKNC